MNVQEVRRNNVPVLTCADGDYAMHHWTSLFDLLDELDCPAVIDISVDELPLSDIEIYLVILHAEECDNVRRHRIGFVAGDKIQGQIRFLTNSGRLRDLNFEAFDNIDPAVAWVSGTTSS